MDSPLFKFFLAAVINLIYWLFILPDLITRKSSLFPFLGIVFAAAGATICVKLFIEIGTKQGRKK